MCVGGGRWRQREGKVFKLGEVGYLQSLLYSNVNILRRAQVIACWRPRGPPGLLRLISAVWKLLSRPQRMGMGSMRHVLGLITTAGSSGHQFETGMGEIP